MSDLLTIRFTGSDNVKPPEIRSRDIAQIIEAYEDAIVSIALEEHPELRKDAIRVSLIEIQDASVGLIFRPNLPQISFPAALKINEAIKHGSFFILNERARECLRKISNFTKKHQCEAVFIAETEERQTQATLAPTIEIPRAYNLKGETVLYGEVKRAGGIEPTVWIQTIDGETLYCPTTTVIAVQLGKMLYEQVAVMGHATWDFETFQVKEFTIQEVLTDYRKTSLPTAFAHLREIAGEAFDKIVDVNQYVKSLRDDGDPD